MKTTKAYYPIGRMLRLHSILSSGKLFMSILTVLFSMIGAVFGLFEVIVVVCVAVVGVFLIVGSTSTKKIR